MRWARGLWRTLALTLRWAESSPLLRWAQTLKRARPYYAGPPHSTARLSHLGTMPCPLLRWAHDLCMSCPYFALGRVLATFALGSDSVALTTRGCHAQRLVCPTWTRDRVGDRPLLRWAHDFRMSGPYFALGRDRAAFALGQGHLALPLLCAGPRLWRLCICQGLWPWLLP